MSFRHLFIVFAIFFLRLQEISATSLNASGNLISDTTWSVDTVNILGDFTILNTVKLTIIPGVTILVHGDYLFTVNGWIASNGNVTDSIIFSNSDSTNSWKGITINDSSSFSDTMLLSYTAFKGCKTHGGIKMMHISKIKIDHCTFINLKNTNGGGGAIYMMNSKPIITNCLFEGNTCTDQGGAIMIESSSSSILNSEPFIYNNSFINNSTLSNYDDGGAIYCFRGSLKYTIKDNLFKDNRCTRWGGALSVIKVDLNIIGNTFRSNEAVNLGAAIYLDSSTTSIEHNYLDSNFATVPGNSAGSGVFAIRSTPTITSNTFTRNIGTNGAAICCSTGTIAVIKHNIILNNSSFPGLTVLATPFEITMDSNIIKHNEGNIALLITSDSILLRGNVIDSNLYNGVIINELNGAQQVLIEGNFIRGNGQDALHVDNEAQIRNNVIMGNNGSGIYVIGNNVHVTGNDVFFNNAGINVTSGKSGILVSGNRSFGNSGPGIIMQSDGWIINNEIRNNMSGTGAGITISSGGSPEVISNLISNNTATSGYGGGISISNSSQPIISNNTIANNYATTNGGGIGHYAPATISFYNNIIYGNTAGGNGQQMYVNQLYHPNLYSNNIQGGIPAIYYNFGSFAGIDSINIDTIPGFVNPSSGVGHTVDTNQLAQWHLLSNSALINRGLHDTTGLHLPKEDMMGAIRVQDFIIDIGAFESYADFTYAQKDRDYFACINEGLVINGLSNWPKAQNQWFFDGLPLSGENNDSLLLFPIDSTSSGIYRLRVVRQMDTAWSDSIIIKVSENTVIPSLGQDTSICGLDSFVLRVNTGMKTYHWNTGDTLGSMEVPVSGQYYCSVIDTNNCPAHSDTIFVIRHPLVPPQTLGNNDTLCGNDSVQLSISIPGSYLWSTSDTTSSIIINDSGLYYVQAYDTNSCLIEMDSIYFHKFSRPVVSWNTNHDYCINDSIVLLNTGLPINGRYKGSGMINDTLFNPFLPGSGVHNLSYVYTDSNNCVDSAINQITVFALKTFSSLGNDTSACTGDSLLLDAGLGFKSYSWSTLDTSSFIYASSTFIYSVFLIDSNDCQQRDSIAFIVNARPVVNWLGMPDLCTNEAQKLINNGTPLGGIYSGPGMINDSVFDPMVSGSGVHTLSYTYVDSNNCEDSSMSNIQVFSPKTYAWFGSDTTLCFDSSLVLDPGFGFTSYYWQNGDSLQTMLADSSQKFKVTLVDSNNCVQSDSIDVTIFQPVIYGIVEDQFNFNLDSSVVLLLKYNPNDTSLLILDSTTTNVNGEFDFTYSSSPIYIKVFPDVLKYPNLLPVYNTTSLTFQNAKKITLDPCDSVGLLIKSHTGVNPGGSGSIGGTIKLGNGVKSIGDPIAQLDLILMNSKLEAVMTTRTNSVGYFNFKSLASDTFYIWVDKPLINNAYAPEIILEVSENVDSLDFVLHRNYLELRKPIGYNELSAPIVGMYPNPAKDKLNISAESMERIILFDMNGRILLIEEANNLPSFELDISSIKEGLYIVKVSTSTGFTRKKLLITR